MARKALINKSRQEPKFGTRGYHRCNLCGRGHAYIRDFGICRLCFRKLAHKGEIPGVKKASW
jgi:small subunit ribosomal protein S14